MKVCKTEQEYIDAVAPAAQRVCKRYGFLPSILISQTCLENGFGISSYWDNPEIEQLLKHNCMVGQKAELLNETWLDYTVWDGKKFSKKTPEEYSGKVVTITDWFRAFDSVERSFADYILFLLYAKDSIDSPTYRYGSEIVNIKDPEKLITEVGKKYATGSSYAKSVMRIVKKHNLTKYDDLTEVEPTDIVPSILKEEIPDEELKPVVKKLVAPKFIDNRKASQSQVPAWRDKSEKKYIVLHYLGVVGQNFELWDNGYGATFTIAWNGDVYYTADYTAVTWQCGGKIQGEKTDGDGVAPHRFYGKCTNYNSVSIEVCVKRTDNKYEGDDHDDKWYFTEESQESLVWAVSKMMDDLNIPIDRVIRHFDVSGKNCPNPYTNNKGLNGNWTWKEFKANLAQYRKDGTITLPYDHDIIKKDYLSKGDSGDAVQTMQMMLIACGYSCGSYGTDGDFGSATDNALKEFQKAQKLKVNGHYDEATKSALEKAYKEKTEKKTKYSTVWNGLNYSPVYNYTYYKKKYADLRKAFGTNKQKYFNHFCEYGIKEGRQGSAKFNVHKYKARYKDLRDAFGDDLKSYYKHYIQYGKKEGRKAT